MSQSSKRLRAALKRWELDRWLRADPVKVLEWAEELKYLDASGELLEGQAETVAEVLQKADWLIWFCRQRLTGLKEKQALRVLAMARKDPRVVTEAQRRRTERFLGAKEMWRRKIAELEVGNMTDETDAD